MESARKAFVMLAAALTMTSLGTDAAQAAAKGSPGKPGIDKQRKKKRPPVKRVKRARRRPADFEPDLGMPAGTAYDVLCRRDVG